MAAEKDVTRITVSNYSVGLVGLGHLMERMTATHSEESDEEIQLFMLECLERDNYIPGSARADYGKAFVREFRKHLGQPYLEEAPASLDVKILGAGCSQCRQLTQTAMEVLSEMNLPGNVEHVTDVREIARFGLMGSPALLVNGKVVFVGSVPPRSRIREWLAEAGAFCRGKQEK